MRIALSALVIMILLAPGCRQAPQVGLEISLPRELVSTTAWFEVGAFEGARCASLSPMLGDGVPAGWTERVAFRRDVRATPAFGEIPNARHAFGAVARTERCEVIAAGCTELDVGKAKSVKIQLHELEVPSGGCAEGAACRGGRCAPSNDNSDPTVGAGCSLELLGAGPLVSSVRQQGTLLSAPAIAVTPTGFLITYREVEPSATTRIVLQSIDLGGGALAPVRPLLPGRCGSDDEVDGVGLVLNGRQGMAALARPACDGTPALELLNFEVTTDADDPGRPVVGDFRVSGTLEAVSLSSARAAAGRRGGGLLVFAQGGAGRIVTLSSEAGVADPVGSFGASAGITDAWVTTSDKVVALLAAGRSAPDPEPGPEDEPDETRTLRLVMAPVDTPADAFDAATDKPVAPIVFPGAWGSLAAAGERVIVLSHSPGSGDPVTYRAFDLGASAPRETSGIYVEDAKPVLAGDVAIAGDRAFFATLQERAVELLVYGSVSTTPTPLASRALGREGRVSGLERVRDGRVAVAATDTRVAVAWTTAQELTDNDPAGGYAVFACSD